MYLKVRDKTWLFCIQTRFDLQKMINIHCQKQGAKLYLFLLLGQYPQGYIFCTFSMYLTYVLYIVFRTVRTTVEKSF